jgi:hypothetical protein
VVVLKKPLGSGSPDKVKFQSCKKTAGLKESLPYVKSETRLYS